MEKSKLAAAMFIVGSIGLFVHYIPLPPAVIACARAVIGTLFLLLVLRLKKTPLHGQAIRKNALCLLHIVSQLIVSCQQVGAMLGNCI